MSERRNVYREWNASVYPSMRRPRTYFGLRLRIWAHAGIGGTVGLVAIFCGADFWHEMAIVTGVAIVLALNEVQS